MILLVNGIDHSCAEVGTINMAYAMDRGRHFQWNFDHDVVICILLVVLFLRLLVILLCLGFYFFAGILVLVLFPPEKA